MGDPARRRGNQPTENKPNGIFYHLVLRRPSRSMWMIIANSDFKSESKGQPDQIDALATIDAGSL